MNPRSAYRLAFGNSLLLVIGVLLFALSTTRVAQAADFTVTTTDDTNDGVCNADCSLREAISAANASPGADVITVPAGAYTLTIGTLGVYGPTTINGAGPGLTVMDGASGGFDIYSISGPSPETIPVTLSGLTIRHGYKGINASSADLVLSRTEVVSNTGGGISLGSAALSVFTSTIGYNTGGGISAASGIERLVLQGSTITGNTVGRGGGVEAYVTGQARIIDTIVSHNTATSGSGGYGGGGLLLQTWGSVEIAGSTIEYNAATGDNPGGGLHLDARVGYGNSAAAVTIRDSRFAHNSAGFGGGLYVYAGVPVTLTHTTVAGNQAVREDNPPSGGGIEVQGEGSIAFVDSTISDNVAHRHTITPSGCGAPLGAGINDYSSGPLLIANTTISNNRAVVDTPACNQAAGGGVLIWLAPYTITDSLFVGNSAETGGGLSGGGGGVVVFQNTIRNTQFLSNTASAGDGGGFIGNDIITAIGVTLQGNSATGNGGGAYVYNTLTLSQSLVKDNTAGGDGGGLAGGAQVLSSTITGNRAANGGGLALLEADVAQSLIAGNRATGKGGGISVLFAGGDGPTIRIHNSTISGNQAAASAGISHGGPVYKLCQGPNTRFQYGYGGKMLLDNTTIAANVSVTGTGGIRVNIEERDRDVVEQAECPDGFVNWGTGSGVVETKMVNVLVADNTGDNCTDVAADASQGHNLSDDATCLFTAAGDQTKLDAKLGPLQNNGGPTWTHALLAGSPAIDSASNASCPAIDQRGVVRPQGVACDIGAYEFTATTAFLAVTPQTLTFAAVAGANPPPAQGFQIANTGVGVLNWTASEGVSWLSLDKTSGTAPATVNLAVDTTNLTPGNYSGAITISASSANGSPQTVSVALQVVSAANLLRNGDFEAGPTGWTETSSQGRALIRQGGDVPFTTPRSGGWAAVLGQVNGETSDLSQAVLLPGGDDLALIYYTFGQSAESRCDLEIAEVRINGSTVASHPLCQANNSSGWTKQTVDLNAYRGQNVTLHFYLKNDGISDPSTLLVDDVQLQFGVESATGAVTPANGGAVTSGDGKISITFPPGAVNGPIDVALMTQGAPSQPAGGYRFAGKSFVVEATDSSGRPVTQFNQPFTLRVDYVDSDWQNTGITEESDLNLYFWNGAQWTPLLPCVGCSHDLNANRIVAVLDHLTEFAVLAGGGAAPLYLPIVIR